MGLLSLEEEDTRDLSLSLCKFSEKSPCAGTVRRQLPTPQGDMPHQKPVLTAPLWWPSVRQNCGKIDFLGGSHLVWATLLWQPYANQIFKGKYLTKLRICW